PGADADDKLDGGLGEAPEPRDRPPHVFKQTKQVDNHVSLQAVFVEQGCRRDPECLQVRESPRAPPSPRYRPPADAREEALLDYVPDGPNGEAGPVGNLQGFHWHLLDSSRAGSGPKISRPCLAEYRIPV